MRKRLLLLSIFSTGFAIISYSQSCPACSNPALQSSEKLEAGTDTLHRGTFRSTINVISGFNYQGGHPSLKGISPEGTLIVVPLHHHIVSLDFYRFETSLEYTIATNWTIWMRVPFDIKLQNASVDFVQPVSNYERDAIIRNRDLHHRNERYSGLSDLRLLFSRRYNSVLGRLDLAIGTSIPSGKTENDPLQASDLGIKHLHIQFGNGTFDPLLEFHYVNTISEKFSFAFYSMNKFPFYENKNNYLGSLETTTGIALGYHLRNWMVVRGTFTNFTQSQAKWSGVKDPNSGLVSFNGSILMSFRFKNALLFTPGYRFPIYQRTLSGEGDTFEYGPTFLLNVSYALQKKYELHAH